MCLRLIFLLSVVIIPCAASPLFEMSDNKIPFLQLTSGTDMAGGRLFMRNKGEGAVIPNSKNWHLTDKGFTIAATIKLNRRHKDFGSGYGADGKFLYDHDIIAAKDGEFVFGRRSDRWSDQLYFNFVTGGKWGVPLVGTVGMPPYGSYAHVAITVERRVQDNRGLNGYNVTYYMNGEPEKEQLVNCGSAVSPSNASWRLGAGLGIRNDKWSFDGEMTDVFFFDRVLTENEVMALAVNSRPAKIAKMSGVQLRKSLENKIASLEKTASHLGKWVLDISARNCRNGSDQQRLASELDKIRNILKISDAEKFASAWNNAGISSKILSGSRSMLFINTGRNKSGFPIAGWYDLKRKAEIFGMTPPNWELSSHLADGQPVKQNSPGTPYTLTYKKNGRNSYSGKIVWLKENTLKAVSEFTFSDNRLEMNLSMKSLNDQLFLDSVSFPHSRLRRLRNGVDKFLSPKMSGVVFEKPISRNVPQPWKNYPNGELNMQFHAYYDDLGGIYLGAEDPYGGNKHFVMRPRNGELETIWTHPVAYRAEDKGGKKFELSGKGVWEIFDGDWFDAGRIYRRFLASKAKWWIKELPRKSTPEWYRNNTFWILQLCFNEWDHYNTIVSYKQLRKYFDLPFAMHYYEWFDRTKGEFPHFYPKTRALQALTELNDIGVYVKPYTDNRTWARRDGLAPGKDHLDCLGFYRKKDGHYDFQFKDIAEAYATRSKEGDLTLEGGGTRCAVMCPAVPDWQDYIFRMSRRLAGQGFDAVYHDEVTTAQPMPCFNPAHGHLLNSPFNWLRDGYWKMFEKISSLRSKYPDLCHDSEDASEPFMQYLDGVCPFRWIDTGQVPLFASIYSGRTQFSGRIYDHVKPGHKESFFDKMATQLVNSEQLGWFTADYMNDPEKRLYTKRLMHLRHNLLNYFNCGEMDRPLKFKNMPTRNLMWGSLTAQRILTPYVHNGVFKLSDGTRMAVFINATPQAVTFEPVIPSNFGKIAVCDGKNPSVLYNTDSKMTLAPRQIAVIVASNDRTKLKAEAERIHQALVKINGFTPGIFRHDIFTSGGDIPEKGLHYDFEDYPVWHTQPTYRGEGCFELIGHPERRRMTEFNLKLEPNTEYELEIAIRKDLDTKSILRVGNYSKNNKITHYAVIGEDVPADGVWHHRKIKFKTDGDVHQSALYLYLEPTTQTLRIDELKIKKVN